MAMSINNKLVFDYSYNISLVNFVYVNEVKDLGITFDNNLNFNTHIINKIKTAFEM